MSTVSEDKIASIKDEIASVLETRRKLVIRFAESLLEPRLKHLAEDAVQKAFIDLVKTVASELVEDGELVENSPKLQKAHVWTVVRNKVLGLARRAKTRRKHDSFAQYQTEKFADDPKDIRDRDKLRTRLFQLLAGLSEEEQELLDAKYWGECGALTDLANERGIVPSALSTRLKRLLKKLRRQLEKDCDE